MAYDRKIISRYACTPGLVGLFVVLTFIIFFIVQTYRTIRLVVMSARLKRMQRLYLVQLVLQAFIPLILVIIPASGFILIMMFEIYGFACKFD